MSIHLFKLNLLCQLLATAILVLALWQLRIHVMQLPVAVLYCQPNGLLLSQMQPEPHWHHSLILGQAITGISAAGAILYAVPLQNKGVSKGEWPPGQVLWQRGAYTARPMASMTKLMSLLLVQEYLKDKDVNELRRVPRGGAVTQRPFDASVAWLKQGQTVTWAQLLSYVVIASANDAAYTLAILVGKDLLRQQFNKRFVRQFEKEPIAESSENLLRQLPSEREALAYFVAQMNRRAAQLKLSSARFIDPDGWGDQNVISPLDMARLAAFYSKSFPRASAWHRQVKVKVGGRQKANTNLLLPYYPEIEGLKTGFTYGAGFNFTATVRRNGWLYIAVVMGIQSQDLQQGLLRRAAEAEILLNWGLANFTPLNSQALTLDYWAIALAAEPTGQAMANIFGLNGWLVSLVTNLAKHLVRPESLNNAAATITQRIDAHLLPATGVNLPRLLQHNSQTIVPIQVKFSWHLFWNGAKANYGEIRLQGQRVARFALRQSPQYVIPELAFLRHIFRLQVVAR